MLFFAEAVFRCITYDNRIKNYPQGLPSKFQLPEIKFWSKVWPEAGYDHFWVSGNRPSTKFHDAIATLRHIFKEQNDDATVYI